MSLEMTILDHLHDFAHDVYSLVDCVELRNCTKSEEGAQGAVSGREDSRVIVWF